ncbi:MAG: hypothetical protein QM771_16450 [Nitrospira sp.]
MVSMIVASYDENRRRGDAADPENYVATDSGLATVRDSSMNSREGDIGRMQRAVHQAARADQPLRAA